ncbi:MAG: hypothetical protein ACRC6S_03545, partial [Shewanella sp.]
DCNKPNIHWRIKNLLAMHAEQRSRSKLATHSMGAMTSRIPKNEVWYACGQASYQPEIIEQTKLT